MAMKALKGRLALLALTVIVGVSFALALVGTAAAQQKDPYSNRGPQVLPSVIERGEPERPPAVQPNRQETPPDDSNNRLPFTGADLTLFVATGLAAVATGGVILRRTRSRSFE
jgi:hypothetical protein